MTLLPEANRLYPENLNTYHTVPGTWQLVRHGPRREQLIRPDFQLVRPGQESAVPGLAIQLSRQQLLDSPYQSKPGTYR